MKDAIALNQQRRRENGSLVLVAVFLVALFAMGALSVDVGNAQLQRKKIFEGADAAAMAAVIDWWNTGDKTVADTTARGFAQTNGVLNSEIVSVKAGKWQNGAFIELNALPNSVVPAVQVIATRQVNMVFGKVIGFSTMSPQVESVAIVAKATAVSGGALPWGLCTNQLGGAFTKCMPLTLKNGTDCGGPGNFGALAIGGTGGSVYKDNIRYGVQIPLSIGEVIDTEPGNKVGPTKQGLDDRLAGLPQYNCTSNSPAPGNARLGIVPIVNDLDVNGRKPVVIQGFMVVILDDSGGGGSVTAKAFDAYSGSQVDPTAPPVHGFLSSVVLVQ